MKKKARIVPISQIDSSYWNTNSNVIDVNGKELPWQTVMLSDPNYLIYVDDETELPISGNNLSEYYLDKGVTPNSGNLLEKADAEEIRQAKADERVHKLFDLNSWLTFLGTLAAGAAAAGGLYYALPVVDAALTPSTWLDLIGAPKWLGTTANLALTGAGVYHNGKEFLKNPTYGNAALTALSFIPLTRTNPSSIEIPWIRKLMEYSNLARQINNDVKDAHLFNIPIEHVSDSKVLNGTLEASKGTDMGLHFVEEGSPVVSKILSNPENKNMSVHKGVWTYSNNTAPINAGYDYGAWDRYTNPDFYKGLNWEYPELKVNVQDVLTANQKNPNWYYTNNFEGDGYTSFMTTEPSFGMSLSKNETPIGFLHSLYTGEFKPRVVLSNDSPEGFTASVINPEYKLNLTLDDLRDIHNKNYDTSEYVVTHNDVGENYIAPSVSKEVQEAIIDPQKLKVIDYLNSGDYARRLIRAGFKDLRQAIINKATLILNNTHIAFVPNRKLSAFTLKLPEESGANIVISTAEPAINDGATSLEEALLHEFGHAWDLNLFLKHNTNLLKDARNHLLPNKEPGLDEYLDYILRIGRNKKGEIIGTEGRGELEPHIIKMNELNLTPQQFIDTYYDSPSFNRLRNTFDEEYLGKLLRDYVYEAPELTNNLV